MENRVDTDDAPGVRVLVVEPSEVFVIGLHSVLGARGMIVAGVARHQTAAVALAGAVDADIALVSLRLAHNAHGNVDHSHGISTLKMLRSIAPQLRLLAMSLEIEPTWVIEAVRAGASGYISKEAPVEDLYHALLEVAHGDVALRGEQLAALLTPRAAVEHDLTPREICVLKLLAEGRTNQEIAEALTISVGTARTHVGNILGKLGVNNRREAAKAARELGLLP
ncbi:MAG: response regulator transcription factor [Anaerolineae bacterium]